MENILSCGVCGVKFPGFDNFRTHMKEHLTSGEKTQQTRNEESVRHAQKILTHLRKPVRKIRKKRKTSKKIKKDEIEGEYKCDYCEKIFKYQPLLTNHLKLHNQERLKDYCSKCNSRFVNPRALQIHKTNCPPKNPGHNLYFQCPACPLNFVSEERRNEHERIQHARLRCPNCTLSFYDRSFVSHLKTCSKGGSIEGDGDSRVQTFIVSANVKGLLSDVSESGKQTNYAVVSNEVMKHLKSQLEGKSVETLYLCKSCNHAFKNMNQLEAHQQSCGASEISSSPDKEVQHSQDDENDDNLFYTTDGGVGTDPDEVLECDTVVGEEVVLDQDGFQEMEVNLQDSSDLNYLVSDTGDTYVVCLDNHNQQDEETDPSADVSDIGADPGGSSTHDIIIHRQHSVQSISNISNSL